MALIAKVSLSAHVATIMIFIFLCFNSQLEGDYNKNAVYKLSNTQDIQQSNLIMYIPGMWFKFNKVQYNFTKKFMNTLIFRRNIYTVNMKCTMQISSKSLMSRDEIMTI